MRNILLFILLFQSGVSFSQLITENPKVDKKNSTAIKIKKVTLTDKYTIIAMSFREPSTEEEIESYMRKNPEIQEYLKKNPSARNMIYNRLQMQMLMNGNSSTQWISINPKSFLVAESGKKFRFIKANDIPEIPDSIVVEAGNTYHFTLFFEKLDKGIEVFDLIEGYPKKGESRQYWNFNGIHINNPLNPTQNTIDTPVQLSIKGTLFDAISKQPIIGNIRYEAENSTIKITESTSTNTKGEFSFKLSPRSYLFTAKAEGYETETESLDLSKISRNQQFTQNFFLRKIGKKEEPKPQVEEPKKEETVLLPRETPPTPIKVEDNKFRLDKVYFPLGEATILEGSFEQLDGLVMMMKEKPKMKILIEGHTDNVGDAGRNKRLSLERAFNVREYLVKKGISGSRIQFKGYGDTKPIASNETEEGRQANRRVEFVIINQ
jgi:OOP family OmpA-OmpF porin